MSSTESISDTSYTTEDSEYDFVREYEIQDEFESAFVDETDDTKLQDASNSAIDIPATGPYSQEPIASKEWLQEYEREKKEEEERRQELQDRLEGSIAVGNWCSCGKCNTGLLQNVYECRCCAEIDDCVAALHSDLVLQEVEYPPPVLPFIPVSNQFAWTDGL